MPEKDRLNRVAFSSCALAVCLFVFLSLVSFSIYDYPNPDVAPARIHDMNKKSGRTRAVVANNTKY